MSSILINLPLEKAYSQFVSSPVTAFSWKMRPNWPNKSLSAASICQASTCLKVLTRSTSVIVNTIMLIGVQNGQIKSRNVIYLQLKPCLRMSITSQKIERLNSIIAYIIKDLLVSCYRLVFKCCTDTGRCIVMTQSSITRHIKQQKCE